MDDAAVRRVRHGCRDERALPVPAGTRTGRAVGGVRHADVDGHRLRRPPSGGGGRSLRRGDRHARGLRDALRSDPVGRHLHVDDDQRAGGGGVRVLPGDGGAAGRGLGSAGRHAADRHHEGVHRAEGVDLPAASAPAPDRGPDGVLRRTRPSLASRERVRLSHPGGRRDGGAGAGVHAGGRLRLRRAGASAWPRRGHVRAGAVVLLQRTYRLLRGDREAPGGPADLGALAEGPLRRHRSQRDEAPVPHADGRRVAHRAAADEQRGADRDRGAGRRARRHAVPPHERARRGVGATYRGEREARAPHATGDRATRVACPTSPIRSAGRTSWKR